MKMTERGQITISQGDASDTRLHGAVGAGTGLSRWRGALRNEMLADGYSSTRELMKDLRKRSSVGTTLDTNGKAYTA